MRRRSRPRRYILIEELIDNPPGSVRRWFDDWIDIVENHYEAARNILTTGLPWDPHPTREALHDAIREDRKHRDLQLHALSSFRSCPPARSIRELARVLREQDRLVDGLLGRHQPEADEGPPEQPAQGEADEGPPEQPAQAEAGEGPPNSPPRRRQRRK